MQCSLLNKLLDEIEVELRRLRYLVGNPDHAAAPSSAFGYGQIPFGQWLGQVFLPNARAAVTANELPKSSKVGAAAVRNLDGVVEADILIGLLNSFDAKINQMGGTSGTSEKDA